MMMGNSLSSRSRRVTITSQTRERQGVFFPFQEGRARVFCSGVRRPRTFVGVSCDVACVLASLLRCVSRRGEKNRHFHPNVWKNATYLRRQLQNQHIRLQERSFCRAEMRRVNYSLASRCQSILPPLGRSMAVGLMESCRWPWTPTADLSLARIQPSDYIICPATTTGLDCLAIGNSEIRHRLCSVVLFCLGSPVLASVV